MAATCNTSAGLCYELICFSAIRLCKFDAKLFSLGLNTSSKWLKGIFRRQCVTQRSNLLLFNPFKTTKSKKTKQKLHRNFILKVKQNYKWNRIYKKKNLGFEKFSGQFPHRLSRIDDVLFGEQDWAEKEIWTWFDTNFRLKLKSFSTIKHSFLIFFYKKRHFEQWKVLISDQVRRMLGTTGWASASSR